MNTVDTTQVPRRQSPFPSLRDLYSRYQEPASVIGLLAWPHGCTGHQLGKYQKIDKTTAYKVRYMEILEWWSLIEQPCEAAFGQISKRMISQFEGTSRIWSKDFHLQGNTTSFLIIL